MFTKDETFAAVEGHLARRNSMKRMISTGMLEISVDDIRSDRHCALGRLLHGNILSEKDKATATYKDIVEIHKEFHAICAEILLNVERKEFEYAQKMLDWDFNSTSLKLIRLLLNAQGDPIRPIKPDQDKE